MPPSGFEELGFKAVVSYYPGCGFFGYFGTTNEDNAESDLYMPYAPSLVIHGEDDGLIDNAPSLMAKSGLHADSLEDDEFSPIPDIEPLLTEFEGYDFDPGIETLGNENNPLARVIFSDTDHSFDEDDVDATPHGRQMAERWLETFLED